MAITPHDHPFTNALLSALGLDGRKITKLSLHVEVDSVVTVDITELVECEETGGLVDLAGKYELHDATPVEA
jgi:hypothetical protein